MMKNLNTNVVVSNNDIIGSDVPKILTTYPPLNKNNFESQNNNSNDMKISLAVLFLEKKDNITNDIEIAENSIFLNSKIGSMPTMQPNLFE